MANLYEIGKTAFIRALEYANVPFTNEGIDKTVKEWARQKQKLYNLLSKHPNWVESELAVIGEMQDIRSPSKSLAENNLRQITEYCKENFKDTIGDKNLDFLWPNATVMLLEKNITADGIASIIGSTTDWEIKPSIGMKSSRFVLKSLETLGIDVQKHPILNAIFASYSEAISPYIKELRYSFSINPGDFVLMSNGSSWSSCHDMRSDSGGPGQWASGPLAYMLDPSSIVMSACTLKNFPSHENNYLNPKTYRMMFFIGESMDLFLQSRLYPGSYDRKLFCREVRKILHEILSTAGGFENMWSAPLRVDGGIVEECDDYFYPDYANDHNGCRVSVQIAKKDLYLEGSLSGSIQMGATPFCLTCGSLGTDGHHYVHCDRCIEACNFYYDDAYSDDEYDDDEEE